MHFSIDLWPHLGVNMTHFVSSFQTAALTICIVLFTQPLKPFITCPPNTSHCYLITSSLCIVACSEQTKALNFLQVTGYKCCQLRKKSCFRLRRFQWGWGCGCAVPLPLNTPTSLWCWWLQSTDWWLHLYTRAQGFMIYSMWVSSEWNTYFLQGHKGVFPFSVKHFF